MSAGTEYLQCGQPVCRADEENLAPPPFSKCRATYMDWPASLPVWRYVAVGRGPLSPVCWHRNWMCSNGGVLWGGQQGSWNIKGK